MEKNMMTRVNKLLMSVIILLTAVSVFLLVSRLTLLKAIAASEQRWGAGDIPIVASARPSAEKHEFVIRRLSDGAEERVPGEWKFSFFSHSEGVLFGNFVDKKEEQRMYQVNANGHKQMNISKLPGPVGNVEENPKQTYVSISGVRIGGERGEKNNTQPYTCVMEKRIALDHKVLPCVDVMSLIQKKYRLKQDESYYSHWHKGKERELAIIEGSNPVKRIFTFDPWEDAQVTTVKDVEGYMGALAAADEKVARDYPNNIYELNRYGRVLEYHQKINPDARTWVWLPSSAPMQWVGNFHVMIFDPKHLYIVNLETREVSEIEPFDAGSTIHTYFPPIIEDVIV